MKRIVLLFFCASLLLACGGEDTDTNADAVDDTPTFPACPDTGALIAAAPRVFEFGPISAGATAQRDLSINSGGTGQACFGDVIVTFDPPEAPFTVGPLIADGQAVSALDPGQTGTLTFTFAPTEAVVDGRARAIITASNTGETSEVELRYSADASTTAPIGTLTVDATIPFILDGTMLATESYWDDHALRTAVVTGTVNDETVPGAGMVATWAARIPADGSVQPYIGIVQQEFATTPFEGPPINLGVMVRFPTDVLTAGVVAPSVLAEPTDATVLVTGVGDDDQLCTIGVGTGSLTVSDPMGTTDVEGGSFGLTGSITVYPPNATPEGDATTNLITLGYPKCAGPSGGAVYVRIDDTGPVGMALEDGADIDAIGLFKADGAVHWAQTVEFYAHGAGVEDQADTNDALGAPNAYTSYPDLTECTIDGGALPLGGMGGTLIVTMPVAVQTGDRIQVLEVGDCDFGGGLAVPENVSVFVGKSADVSGEWISAGTTSGGAETLTVPELNFELP